MSLPADYVERVYAGVLGKIIGVYLGRPFEGWAHERILAELGEVQYYVHERLGAPLVVTDDDISGTFTFVRAMEDYGAGREVSAEQIGQTWLNYIIENRTILWWGGMGNSTEHTAYLRLKRGVPAPMSGAIELNGKVVAEQIGAQIFIDGWAMVAPGDARLATTLARRAASVSHDGEAIYGAQVIAAIEAMAFVEKDLGKLLDAAVAFIPSNSVIARVIGELRALRAKEPDWKKAFAVVKAQYGYDRYGGNCHVVPNHAVVVLALLWGDDSFQRSLMIANTCGWDTDCNSGNVGCILGIKNGLAGIDAGPDWRGPVADRLYLPTADGGRCVTDAAAEAYRLANVGRALAGLEAVRPKGGARFHFALPGAVQGWAAEEGVAESRGVATVGHASFGEVAEVREHMLAIRYAALAPGRAARAAVATFTPPDAAKMSGYGFVASPTIYPGQTVRAQVLHRQEWPRVAGKVEVVKGVELTQPGMGDRNAVPVTCRLYARVYGADDQLERVYGPAATMPPSQRELVWKVPDTAGAPIAEIGIEVTAARRTEGVVYLYSLTWDGAPDVTLKAPPRPGEMWKRAWVNAVNEALWGRGGEHVRVMQNEGRGLLIQGTREWADYRVSTSVTPHLARAAGLAARVQGMRRYYALLLCPGGVARLVKVLDAEQVLGEVKFAWEWGRAYAMAVEVRGNVVRAEVDGKVLFEVTDGDRPLVGGAVGLVVEEGRVAFGEVRVGAAG